MSGEVMGTTEIPPQIVRDIAQSRPAPGDFRERFPEEQPEVCEFIGDMLGASELAEEFAERLAAALWAMYSDAFDDRPLPPIGEEKLALFLPIARKLLEGLSAKHPEEEEFDAEWLAELPRGAQPHVTGFLLGALRAARFRMSGLEIFETATVLFAVAGALEATVAALRAPAGETGGNGT